jgi:hypothetical protein
MSRKIAVTDERLGESYVQVVGADCAQCSRGIISLVDGAVCPECSSAVHVDDACWREHWVARHAGSESYRDASHVPPPPPPAAFPERDADHATPGEGDLLCTECHHRVFAATKLTFSGFRQFRCPRCEMAVLAPLSTGRRRFYIGAVGLSAVAMVYFLMQGMLAFPGALAIWAGTALYKNRKLEQKLLMQESEPLGASAPEVRRTKRKKRRPAGREARVD